MPSKLPPALRPWWPRAKRAVLRATKTLAPATRRFSRVFGERALPQASAPDSAVFLASVPGAAVSTVYPGGELARCRAQGLPAEHWVFRGALTASVPDTKIALIPQGRIVGGLGAVVGPKNTLLFDLSPYFAVYQPDEHMVFFRLRLPPLTRTEQSVAVLDTRGSDNYFHFLFDVLARLGVIEASSDADVDAYYLPQQTRFQRELLSLVGYGDVEIIDSVTSPHLQARRLIVPSIASADLDIPSWVIDFLRSRLLPATPSPATERIYITRGEQRHSRSIVNETQVREVLDRLGFRAVDPGTLSVAEQIELFRTASVIVSPHGAALANLVFVSSGAAVLELFPPDYINPCYYGLLAHFPDVRYRYLIGDGPLSEPGDKLWGVASDITVDVEALQALLAELDVA